MPIGRPIANTQTYILDKHLQPVPIGVLGELYLGGTNLARGYLNRPKLTKEKFIVNPFVRANSPKGFSSYSSTETAKTALLHRSPLLYKTGDLARYRSDRNIEFLGRIDHQVKLRGFRIELGEIEAVLDTHPQVQQAVVLATDDLTGNKRLVAYLASHESLEVAQLRSFLGAKLPEYMVPNLFITLDTIPLTPNGKVDRRALPAPDVRQSMEKSYQAPASVTEKSIADIWKRILNLEKVGVSDNFFELGGNSLLAMQIVSRMRQLLAIDLSLDSLFNSPTIAELTLAIERDRQVNPDTNSIAPVSRDLTLPVTSGERSLWLFEKLHPHSCVYNIPLNFKLNGAVESEILEQCLNQIISRHEIFRTSFVEVEGELQRIIAAELTIKLPVVEVATEVEANIIAKQEASQPFDLDKEPLLRAKLLRLSSDRHRLLITCHHIVFDGWSIQILFDELVKYYDALSNDRATPLAKLEIQYADYANWQQQWLQGDRYTQQLDYWRSQLATATPSIELPTDRARPSVQTYAGDRLDFQLDADLTQALNSLSRQEGVTLYMTLLTAFKALLYRYTGQSDLVVGTPFANRNTADTEQLIGFLVNTLVLRTQVTGELKVRELLNRVRQVTSGAYANSNLPFEQLIQELQPERDLSYSPFFQVMFALQKQLPSTQSAADLSWEIGAAGDLGCSMFDLTLDLVETSTGIEGHFEYNSDLFDRDTIVRMASNWQTLLAGIVANPEQTIDRLPLLTSAEKQTLIDWNQTAGSQYKSIQQLFETQVERSPDAVAVVFQNEQLTFAQLNQRSNQLAHYLQSLGVTTETLIGVCIERSLDAIVGLLAILKAGSAYVPLDPAYPPERLAYMVEDAKISVLLTQTKWKDKLPQNQAQIVDLSLDRSKITAYSTKNPVVSTIDTNLAYVIYTSGSTGKPKGVMITHLGLSSFTQTAIQTYEIVPSDRILQFASINFDAAVEEIFPCLCAGATLVLRTDEMLTLPTFLKTCQELELTILDLPTAYWHQLVAELQHKDVSLPESLRLVIIGGEAVLPEPVKSWQKYVNRSGKGDRLELINTYGPTEATVVATMYRISNHVPLVGEVPIGLPLAHVQAYVLDRDRQLLPIGVPGELHIGGDSLARGYLNRPDLTSDKFIADPFSDRVNGRLYKTGDLAKYLPNGEIEYLGRIDNQVKIRGFRIELGEIESVLVQHPAINEAAVTVREDGHKSLVAYIVGISVELQNSVRSFLRDRLPNYMMPSSFVFLDAMPLTPNGKINRRALPAPDISRADLVIVPPTNDLEAKLVKIWSEVMDIQPLGIQDNFFELGGHSLLAVKLIGEIERQLDRKLPLTVLVEAPTVRELAVVLQPSPEAEFSSIVELKAGTKTPLFLIHDADGETIHYANLANHLKPEQAVYGIRPRINKASGAPMLPTSIAEIVTDYVREIRQVQPQGPYLIGGLCAGGILAFEIACQLQAEGSQVPLVVIIDAISPQGIGNNYISVDRDRQKSFLNALSLEEYSPVSISNLAKTVFTKVSNLIRYEASTRTKKITDDLKIKLLRACGDRPPQFCQNIPLRSIYIYAEDKYMQNSTKSLYRGRLTLWRATEKIDLDNSLIDDTPAAWEVNDPLLGWDKQATEGVEAHDIPGGHSSMLQNPNVEIMAQKLQPYLDSIS